MEPPLRDARTAPIDELETLVHRVRKELERLGERLPSHWTEEAVEDLRAGRLTGWIRPPGPWGGEIGFFSRRGGRAFAHLHLLEGPDPVARARALAERIAGAPELVGAPLRIGTSGLSAEEERRLAEDWEAGPGRSLLRRHGLERTLAGAGSLTPAPLPPGFRAYPVRSITEAALADLDLRGFSESVDAALFAGDPEEYARVVDGILHGRLGRFLDEASEGLVGPDGRLAAFLLSVELSPRTGLFADLVVEPSQRRRGLGRHLLAWGLRALCALGFEQAQLWVTEGNRPARALYDATGFRPFATTVVLVQAAGPAPGQPQRSA
jgi:ribosomal protein S18 acetylase RimI-like enzyme